MESRVAARQGNSATVRKMRSRRLPNRAFAFCAAAAMLVASCEVGPDYEPPALEEEVIEESFTAVKDPAFSSDEGDIREWWTVFDDPMLTSIIALAEEGNKDLEIAVSRVSEARARLGFAKAGRYPSIGIGGGVNARNDFFTGFETRTVSSIGADVSWELDLFGRVARQIEAENASYEATEEDQRDVRVTLMAEVARAYIGVRALQMQLQSAERNLASQEQILELTRSRTLNGISSELDLSRALSIHAASEAAVPPLRVGLSREVNTLGVLIGKNPTALQKELAEPKPIPVPPTHVTVGVPADLLRQRPDIRAAERRLAAQTARVGIATADLYPTFGIGGSLGFSDFAGGNLLDAGSRAFSLGPSMQWTLFDGGRTRSAIEIADAGVEQALLLYERTVLSALQEVETAMTTFTQEGSRVGALERAAAASRDALRLSTGLYEKGLIDYEQLLDVQRSLLAQEIEVAAARGQAATSLVMLYRALGGGWDPGELDQDGDAPGADAASGDAALSDGNG